MKEHETDVLVDAFLSRAGAALERETAATSGDAELLARCTAAAKAAYLVSPATPVAPPGPAPIAPRASGIFRLGTFGGGVVTLCVVVWMALAPSPSRAVSAVAPSGSTMASPTPPAARDQAPVALAAPNDPLPSVDVATLPAAKSAPIAATEPSPLGPSAVELFSRANAARRDRDDVRAIALYEELLAKHPRAPESAVATITLARLHLERGAPGRALPLFESAAASSTGVLREEAMIGRARCYEQLGRSAEERDAWRALLRAFPGTVARSHALERLDD